MLCHVTYATSSSCFLLWARVWDFVQQHPAKMDLCLAERQAEAFSAEYEDINLPPCTSFPHTGPSGFSDSKCHADSYISISWGISASWLV